MLGSVIEITAAQDETSLIKRKKKSQFYNFFIGVIILVIFSSLNAFWIYYR